MVVQQGDANGIGAVAFEQVANQRQVAQRFAHLFAILVYHAGMHPEARKGGFAAEVFRLRDFAGMVRESQIRAAAVYV